MRSFGQRVSAVARDCVDGPRGAPIRAVVMGSEALAESALVKSQARKSLATALNWKSLSAVLEIKPEADTFFVLGSGSSIEDLTTKNFMEIERNRSVGINNWPVHSFVPDFFSFESVPRVGDGMDFPRALQLLSRKDIVERRPPVLVLRPNTGAELRFLNLVPLELRRKTFLYGRITPATRLAERLNDDFGFFFRSTALRHPSVLMDSGASVVRMAVLGILLGYRNITFAGVDLTNTQYFWERNPAHLQNLVGPAPVNNQLNSVHETLLTGNRPFSVAEIIGRLSAYVKEALGGRVSVTSPQSALSQFLEPHPWKEY